jgi:hypothetical protein
MKITREFAMPSRHTFTIKPIYEIIYKYIGESNGVGWIDPFAGENSPAEFTNDLNAEKPTMYHLDSLEFLKMLPRNDYTGILFDPPYSLTQVKECYNGIGIEKLSVEKATKFPSLEKSIAATKIRLGGYAICCGWNSIGFGKKRGFEMIEILFVPHGRKHNDTIVTVERKISEDLFH